MKLKNNYRHISRGFFFVQVSKSTKFKIKKAIRKQWTLKSPTENIEYIYFQA